MTIRQEFICIACPIGCSLIATKEGGNISVAGNRCRIGIQYAIKEMTDPRRVLTTSVRVYNGGNYKMMSVKTAEDIPKDKMLPCLKEIKKLDLQGCYNVGDILIEDVLCTGVNVVATRGVVL
ncbi:MAG: DUF1667 domain-containing protein [Defluviitaleaceae bacterium]|nr:DUF1667 domain-containing protein [Defluviitaleaceae bacterium]